MAITTTAISAVAAFQLQCKSPLPTPSSVRSLVPRHRYQRRRSCSHLSNASKLPSTYVAPTGQNAPFTSRFRDDGPRKGFHVLVEALEGEGVTTVFAYPGGASMEIHQALTRSATIRNVLPRHEQGGIFADEGYARSPGSVGVCIATSGPGATNLISGLADALLDSVPLVAITAQVPRRMIGTVGTLTVPSGFDDDKHH